MNSTSITVVAPKYDSLTEFLHKYVEPTPFAYLGEDANSEAMSTMDKCTHMLFIGHGEKTALLTDKQLGLESGEISSKLLTTGCVRSKDVELSSLFALCCRSGMGFMEDDIPIDRVIGFKDEILHVVSDDAFVDDFYSRFIYELISLYGTIVDEDIGAEAAHRMLVEFYALYRKSCLEKSRHKTWKLRFMIRTHLSHLRVR